MALSCCLQTIGPHLYLSGPPLCVVVVVVVEGGGGGGWVSDPKTKEQILTPGIIPIKKKV